MAGLGSAFVRAHLPALRQLQSEGGVKVVAAADPDHTRRSAAAAELGDVQVFETADDMLAAVPSDLLVVAAEPSAHAQLVLLGTRHRVHVLCEKPLTLRRGEHEAITAAYARHPARALVALHQYRYSRAWGSLATCARTFDRLRVPFELAVDVRRAASDPHAATGWRLDTEASGGMLADHGVHFLALGWTVSTDIEILFVERVYDNAGREYSKARIRFGCGALDLRVAVGAPERCTTVDLRAGMLERGWRDAAAHVAVRGRTIGRWRVDALSDRAHVDGLYLPLYRDLIANLSHASWRALRTAEALAVGGALVSLIESPGSRMAAA